jgi:CBS domain-containing protein
MTTARDIMSPTVHVILPTATIREAATLMRDHRIGALPVVDDRNHLIGIVTDRDLIVFAIAFGAHVEDTIEQYGVREVATVDLRADLDDVQRIMSEHRVHRLPVVYGEELLGVISLADLARAVPAISIGTTTSSILQRI